jgi:hypothetical protein
MNLRAAQNELGEPPKIQLLSLVFETVGIVAIGFLLVGIFS